MWDDVLLELVLEEGRGGEVECEHHEPVDVDFYFGCFFEAEAVACVGFGCDFLAFNFQLSLEDVLDDGASWFGFAAAEGEVHVIQEPGQKIRGV